jgi:hypothetical protein
MDQLRNLADDRLANGCIYCGGPEETRDHVPSRVFLDSPPPENLPVVWACSSCNNGFSLDEAYVACLIESVIAGSTDPDDITRPGVANMLRRTPALRARIEAAKSSTDGQTQFNVEPERIRSVVLKLARGHAAFELSQVCREEPASIWWYPLPLMTDAQRDNFDASHVVQMFGEVGSRGLQRLLVTQISLTSANGEESMLNLLINDWLDVQEGCYRYLAIDDGGEIKVKIVIREYLACEVTWAF